MYEMSDRQKENLEYMAMGVAIGIGLGYEVAMYVVYL